jgi:hypothetical protein
VLYAPRLIYFPACRSDSLLPGNNLGFSTCLSQSVTNIHVIICINLLLCHSLFEIASNNPILPFQPNDQKYQGFIVCRVVRGSLKTIIQNRNISFECHYCLLKETVGSANMGTLGRCEKVFLWVWLAQLPVGLIVSAL